MARPLHPSALVYAALLSTTTVALVMGCAESSDVDIDGTWSLDASADGDKKDARSSWGSDASKADASKEEEEEEEEGDDGGSGSAKDSGTDSATDAGSDSGKPDASDAGGDDADSGNPTAPKPLQGEVVISEVMYNPSGTETAEEWIEIHNTTASPKLLSGLVLKDGASPVHSHTIRPGLVIAGGAYVVLAASQTGAIAAKVPAAAIVYDYNTASPTADKLVLGNSNSGSIVLLDGTTEIARAKYGPLGLGNAVNGQSIQLKTLTYAGAAQAASWCKSGNAWATDSDQGTPGAASDCP